MKLLWVGLSVDDSLQQTHLAIPITCITPHTICKLSTLLVRYCFSHIERKYGKITQLQSVLQILCCRSENVYSVSIYAIVSFADLGEGVEHN